MGEKISWMLNVQAQGGPKIAASDTIEVDAYDKFEITVEDGATNKSLEIQPSTTLANIKLILIKPDKPHENLTYKINTQTDLIKLDATQLLIGEGAVKLFGEAPENLVFANSSGEDISIQVLVGRKAIAP